MEDRRLPVEPERGRAGALGYAAMATRLRPVIRGRTVLVVRFFILLTHWGALTLQYDERLSPVLEDLEPAHESSSNDIEQIVGHVKWHMPEVRE